jgi:hypothetical protein
MSDYDDYDFDGRDKDPGKQRGLTRETLDQITLHVLGTDLSKFRQSSGASVPETEPTAPPATSPPLRQPNGRYQPGHSGNPAGPPRKEFSAKAPPPITLDQDLLAAMAEKALQRKLSINRDGVTDQRTIHEIIVDTHIVKAAKGSASSARFLDHLSQRAKRLEAEKRAREYAVWKDRKARYTAAHERSARRGAALNWECPHPDDIVLGPGHEVKIVGPMTPLELLDTRQIYDRAHYWLLVSTYESWLQKRRKQSHRHCPHIHADIVSHYVFQAEQQMLPPRLRLTSAQIEEAVVRFSRTAGRALHDLLRAEAGKLGMPVPPRALRIPFTLAHPLSEELVPDVPGEDPRGGDVRVEREASAAEVFKVAWAELMKAQMNEMMKRNA